MSVGWYFPESSKPKGSQHRTLGWGVMRSRWGVFALLPTWNEGQTVANHVGLSCLSHNVRCLESRPLVLISIHLVIRIFGSQHFFMMWFTTCQCYPTTQSYEIFSSPDAIVVLLPPCSGTRKDHLKISLGNTLNYAQVGSSMGNKSRARATAVSLLCFLREERTINTTLQTRAALNSRLREDDANEVRAQRNEGCTFQFHCLLPRSTKFIGNRLASKPIFPSRM